MTLTELVDWYLDHLDPMPIRMHVRGVWSDEVTSSHLGSPAWSPEWARWLYSSPRGTHLTDEDAVCEHPDGRPCTSCSVTLEDGSSWETGRIPIRTLRYRYPMRYTLHRLSLMPVRPGRPRLDNALVQLRVHEGHVPRAAGALALTYPIMASIDFAPGFFHYALRRARKLYTEAPDLHVRRPYSTRSRAKSDAQLDAEAAGRVDSRQQAMAGTTVQPAAGA